MLSPSKGIVCRHSAASSTLGGPGSPRPAGTSKHSITGALHPASPSAAALNASMHRSQHMQPLAASPLRQSPSCRQPAFASTASIAVATPTRRHQMFGLSLARVRHAAAPAVSPTQRRSVISAALPGQRDAGGLFDWLQVPFSNPSFAPGAAQQQQLHLWRRQQRLPLDPLHDQDELDAVQCDSTAAALVHSVAALLLQRLLLPKAATADKEAIAACEDALILIVDGLESGIGGIPPEQLVPELLSCGVLPALAKLVCDDPISSYPMPPSSAWPRSDQTAPTTTTPDAGAAVLTEHPSWASVVGSWALPISPGSAPPPPPISQPDFPYPSTQALEGVDVVAQAAAGIQTVAGVEGVAEEQLALRSLAIETLYSLLALHILPQVGRYPEAVQQLNDNVVPRILGALSGYVEWLEASAPTMPFSPAPSSATVNASGGADSAHTQLEAQLGLMAGVLKMGQPMLPDELLRVLSQNTDRAHAPAWMQDSAEDHSSGEEEEEEGAGWASPTASRPVETLQQVQLPQQQQQEGERSRRAQLWSDVGTAGLSCALRLCSVPEGAAALVSVGAVPLLCRLLQLQPTRHVAQVCLVFLHKLSHPIASAMPGHLAFTEHLQAGDLPGDVELDMLSKEIAAGALREAALTQLLQAGVVPELCTLLAAESSMPDKNSAAGNTSLQAADGGRNGTGQGGVGGLAVSAGGQGQSVRVDVVGSLLLDMASLPQAPELFAQRGLVSSVVPLLHRRHRPAARMWALLALCRLAGRSADCQMDIVREGALLSLVEMLNAAPEPGRHLPTEQTEAGEEEEGEEEEVAGVSQQRAHAARLLAMLCQASPTHELMVRQGGVDALAQMLRGWLQHRQPPPLGGALTDPWHPKLQAETYGPVSFSSFTLPLDVAHLPADEVASTTLPSDVSMPPASSFTLGTSKDSALPAASSPSLGGTKESLSEDGFRDLAAARHAASALSSLCQNLDLHFELVGMGMVPLLVQLLRPETDDVQVQLHALASLMMVATNDPRHAAVVARAGAIPAVLALLQRCCLRQAALGLKRDEADGEVEGDEDADAEDFCASVLASLCRYDAIQDEFLQADGPTILLQLLPLMHPGGEAASHTAEALTLIASVPRHRLRLTVRASESVLVCRHLMAGPSPSGRYWGASLLNQLCAEPVVLEEIIEQGLAADLVAAMQQSLGPLESEGSDAEGQQKQQQQQQQQQQHSVESLGAEGGNAEGQKQQHSPELPGAAASVDTDGPQQQLQQQVHGAKGEAGGVALDAGSTRSRGSTAPEGVDMEAAAWAATRMLDGALARVQAAWVAAKVAAVEGGLGAESLVKAGAVPCLVGLLIEAVDAATSAGRASRKFGKPGQSASGRPLDVGCEWYQTFEVHVISALQKLQGLGLSVPRPPLDITAATVAQQIASLGEALPEGEGDMSGPAGHGVSGVATGASSVGSSNASAACGPFWVQPRPTGLQSNAGAAAAAALLAIAKLSDKHKQLVQEELQLQGKHPLGHLMFLAGLSAEEDANRHDRP